MKTCSFQSSIHLLLTQLLFSDFTYFGLFYSLNIHPQSGKLLASVFSLSVTPLSTEDSFALSIYFIFM